MGGPPLKSINSCTIKGGPPLKSINSCTIKGGPPLTINLHCIGREAHLSKASTYVTSNFN